MQPRGRTFLITGGASGLGAACARRLVGAGANVVLADVNQSLGAAMQKELGAAARFAKTDVTDAASVQAAVDLAVSAFKGLSGVINCAGIAFGMRVLGKEGPHDLAAFARVLNINVVGTFNVIRLAAVVMSQAPPDEGAERGVIINTASCAAFEGQIGQAAYSASKAAVAGMTLPVARELARFGIRVMTIAPGTFDTPMMASLPQAARESLAQQVPFPPRLGRPDEYALLAEQIILNPMLNGEVIRLDGAMRMGAK